MPLPSDAYLPDDTSRIIADPARFCTGHTLAAGEPLAGTGAHQERNIMIRWPKGRWAHSLRVAAGMSDDLVAAIDEAVAAGWRVNLIDRKQDKGDQVLIFPQAIQCNVRADGYAQLIRAVIDAQDLSAFGPVQTAPSCIFVCTHGKHDACCAKWGFAAYKAIAAKASGYDQHFDVWEVTHLGGCRFAGGALVLPARRKYGRLVPADATDLLAAEAAGNPYLPAYRGGNGLAAPAQVAEVTALRAIRRYAVVHQVSLLSQTETVQAFAVTTSAGRLHVRCTASTLQSYGSCADLAEATQLSPRTVWQGTVCRSDLSPTVRDR